MFVPHIVSFTVRYNNSTLDIALPTPTCSASENSTATEIKTSNRGDLPIKALAGDHRAVQGSWFYATFGQNRPEKEAP